MKINKLFTKLLFAALFLAGLIAAPTSHAQTELWGMTRGGGEYGAGTIFKTDGDGNNQTVAYSPFTYAGNSPLYTHLCEAYNGLLYGMTSGGGANDMGVIFEFDPTEGSYSKIIDFNGIINGKYPNRSLLQASNGLLYGMTYKGGVYNYGVLFEFNPSDGTIIKKIDFNGTNNGRYPRRSLVQASDGLLYGMTSNGGNNGYGVLFEFDPSNGTLSKKIDFDGMNNGREPHGSLVQASNGMLYGVTIWGGTSNKGVLFEFNPSNDSYTKKIDFNGTGNGQAPKGSLILASNGLLYGVTQSGGTNNDGVLYEFNPSNGLLTNKYDDFNYSTGYYPTGNLIQANNGLLYGMTSYGGTYYPGVLFEFNLTNNAYNIKYDFNYGSNGKHPNGGLIQASNNLIYGLTTSGGNNDDGVLFEFDPSDDSYTKKIDFNYAIDGSSFYGSLVQTSNGLLYGLTHQGGASGLGVLFELNPSNGSFAKKIDFDGTNKGSNPYGGLVEASNGLLYGMTTHGGTNSSGVIFEFDPVNGSYVKQFDFDGNYYGGNPIGSLVQASNGLFYGMTSFGGDFFGGVLFEFDPGSGSVNKIIDFDNEFYGGNPQGSLVKADNGRLYGMTSEGGDFFGGVLFEFDPNYGSFNKIIDFDNEFYGGNPQGNLAVASNGKLYGMTQSGGDNSNGVLFAYDPVNYSFNKIVDFDGVNNGRYPYGSLAQSGNGLLYGMTTYGGANDQGVFFEFNPLTGSLTKKFDFDGANGKDPQYTHLIQVIKGSEWTGNNSSNWNDAGNWGFDKVPNQLMDVTIPPTYVNPPIIDQGAVANHLVIDGGHLQILAGGQLILTGNFDNQGNTALGGGTVRFSGSTAQQFTGAAEFGNVSIESGSSLEIQPDAWATINGTTTNQNGTNGLIVKSDQTGSGSLIHNTSSVQGIVEEYLISEQWHLVSSPISDAELGSYLDIYLMDWDEPTAAWNYLIDPVTMLLEKGIGFSTWTDDDYTGTTTVDFAGTINTSNILLNLNYTVASPQIGWNLIGNPYSSAIDWNTNWTMNDVGGWALIYDDAVYRGWNPYLPPGSQSFNGKTDGIIPITQGFWVRATAAGASILLPAGERLHSSQAFYKETTEIVAPTLRLSVEGNNNMDEAVVVFMEDATLGFDGLYDLENFSNEGDYPSLFSIMGESGFAVNVLPSDFPDFSDPKILMGFEMAVPGQCKIIAIGTETFDSDIPIYLEDLLENELIDLRAQAEYSFVTNHLDDVNRFVLHFSEPLGLSVNQVQTQIHVFGGEATINITMDASITGFVKVFDMMGRETGNIKLDGSAKNYSIPVKAKNHYVVKVVGKEGMWNKKVYVY